MSATCANRAPAARTSSSARAESSARSVSTASVTTVTGLPVFSRPRTANRTQISVTTPYTT
ncbi:MAG TPA: hypothetical protein VKJ01_24335 [Candidatus Solibacter sp.]|nr:hypothetical protein [Candidatus Solibacter sp.]